MSSIKKEQIYKRYGYDPEKEDFGDFIKRIGNEVPSDSLNIVKDMIFKGLSKDDKIKILKSQPPTNIKEKEEPLLSKEEKILILEQAKVDGKITEDQIKSTVTDIRKSNQNKERKEYKDKTENPQVTQMEAKLDSLYDSKAKYPYGEAWGPDNWLSYGASFITTGWKDRENMINRLEREYLKKTGKPYISSKDETLYPRDEDGEPISNRHPSVSRFHHKQNLAKEKKKYLESKSLMGSDYLYNTLSIPEDSTGQGIALPSVIGAPVDYLYNVLVNAGLGTRGEKKGYLQDAAEGASELRDLVSGVAENELKALQDIFSNFWAPPSYDEKVYDIKEQELIDKPHSDPMTMPNPIFEADKMEQWLRGPSTNLYYGGSPIL